MLIEKIKNFILSFLRSENNSYTAEFIRYDYIENTPFMILSNIRRNGDLIISQITIPANKRITKLNPMTGDILLFKGLLLKNEESSYSNKIYKFGRRGPIEPKIIAFNQNFTIEIVPENFNWIQYRKSLSNLKIKKKKRPVREPNQELLDIKIIHLKNLHKEALPIFMDKRSFLRISPNKETDKVIDNLYKINRGLLEKQLKREDIYYEEPENRD